MNNAVFFRTKVKAPCLIDCPMREEYRKKGENCHPFCEAYKEYERLKKEEYEQHLKEVEPIWMMNEIEADRVTKYKKMKGRKHR